MDGRDGVIANLRRHSWKRALNTVDSTIDLGNPAFIAINAVFLLTVLAAFTRWAWLIFHAIRHGRLTRRHTIELFALSIPLAALAFTVAYLANTFGVAGR